MIMAGNRAALTGPCVMFQPPKHTNVCKCTIMMKPCIKRLTLLPDVVSYRSWKTVRISAAADGSFVCVVSILKDHCMHLNEVVGG